MKLKLHFHRNWICFSILFIVSSSSFAQEKWSLKQCIEHAKENNISIKSVELNVEQAEIGYSQSKAAMLPNLRANAGQNYNFGRTIDPFTNTFVNQTVQSNNFSLSSGVSVFNGFSIQNNIKAQKFNLLASQQDFEVTKNNISMSIVNSYMIILFNHDAVNLAKERMKGTFAQVDRTEKLVNAGVLSRDNLLNLKAQLANEELQLTNAENQLAISKLSLSQILQLKYSANFDIEQISNITLPAATEIFPDAIFAKSVEYLPEIKRDEHRIKAAEFGNKSAKGGMYPSLSMFGSISTVYSDRARSTSITGYDTVPFGFVSGTNQTVNAVSPNYEITPISLPNQLKSNLGQSFGISLSVPIFSNYNVRTSIVQSELNLKRAKLNADITKNSLYQSITQACLDYQAAQKEFEANKKNADAQLENFKFSEKRFNEGLLNPVEFLSIKNNKEMAEINALQSKYRLVFRAKILDFYMGKPLSF